MLKAAKKEEEAAGGFFLYLGLSYQIQATGTLPQTAAHLGSREKSRPKQPSTLKQNQWPSVQTGLIPLLKFHWQLGPPPLPRDKR